MQNNTVVSKLAAAVFLLFAVTCYQSSYADSDASLIEMVPSVLTFDKPGAKTISIVNNSSRVIAIKDMFFFGDQFSSVPTLRSITTEGLKNCKKVGANRSCKFKVVAAKNASATANIGDANTMFSLVYHFTDKKRKLHTTSFEIRINYNKDLTFAYRNLMFDRDDLIDMARNAVSSIFSSGDSIDKMADTEQAQPLEITNSNPNQTVAITKISLPPEAHLGDALMRIGNYKACKSLAPGASCSVNVIVDNESNDAAMPISILYNVGKRKGVLTIAAVIVKREVSETKIIEAGLAGGIIGQAININAKSGLLSRQGDDRNPPWLAEKLYTYVGRPFTANGNGEKLFEDLAVKSPVDGVLYSGILPFTADLDNLWNRLVFMGTMSLGITDLIHHRDPDYGNYPSTFLQTFIPTFVGSWLGSIVEDHISPYSTLEYVPEDMGWLTSLWCRWFAHSMPFGFGYSAMIRESSKAAFAGRPVIPSMLEGTAQDMVAATAMTGVAKAMSYGSKPSLPMTNSGKYSIKDKKGKR